MANSVPKYRRHPNGQAFVYHKSITKPGSRLYLGKYGTPESRRRYAQFLEQLHTIEEIDNWTFADATASPTLAELAVK